MWRQISANSPGKEKTFSSWGLVTEKHKLQSNDLTKEMKGSLMQEYLFSVPLEDEIKTQHRKKKRRTLSEGESSRALDVLTWWRCRCPPTCPGQSPGFHWLPLDFSWIAVWDESSNKSGQSANVHLQMRAVQIRKLFMDELQRDNDGIHLLSKAGW